MAQMTPEVVGEGRHRLVALGRVALERLRNDRVQSAPTATTQPVARRGALRKNARRLGIAVIEARHGIAEPWRLLFDHGPQYLGLGGTGLSNRRMTADEQFVQQHAE